MIRFLDETGKENKKPFRTLSSLSLIISFKKGSYYLLTFVFRPTLPAPPAPPPPPPPTHPLFAVEHSRF